MKATLSIPLGTPLNGNSPASKGLVGCWPMSEGGGFAARDSTRLNAVDGVLTSGAVFKQSAQGSCVFFDGTNDYISFTTAANYPNLNLTGALTIIAWINTATVALGTKSIVSDSSSSGALQQYSFEVNRAAAKLTFFQGNGTVATSTNTLAANTWYRVGVTRSGVIGSWTFKFYINGVLDSTTTGVTRNPNVQQGMAIGRLGNVATFFFSGMINKVYMYNRALTDTEMMNDFLNPVNMFISKKN